MKLSEHSNHIQDNYESERDIVLTDEIKDAIMKRVNVRSILESWNVKPVLRNGQWTGYCPTHFIHDGHVSHAPKWSMNALTGDSTCFTSNVHEHFITIAKKIYHFSTYKETIDKLLNGENLEIPYELPSWKKEEDIVNEDESRKEKLKKTIETFLPSIKNGFLTKECIDFFKKDGIEEDVIRSLHVSYIDKGYYAGRALIPFLDKSGSICGFVAVNVKGKDWMINHNVENWCKLNGYQNKSEAIKNFTKNYKKALYCPGFQSRNHLYGWYEWICGNKIDDLILVEGERDAIKLLQEGFNAVSIHGTTLKHEQLQLIRKINPNHLFLGFDMDDAGRNACKKIYNQLENEVNQISILSFPQNKDPKNLTREEILESIKSAKGNSIL